MADLQTPANAHHQGKHHHLSRQPSRLQQVPDEITLLSEHSDRKIARSIHESARDVARDVAKTDAYKQSRKDRKKVEMLFAHLKRILKLDRLRLRGPSGAHDEFLLAATAQNLRRMAKWLCPVEPEMAKMAI